MNAKRPLNSAPEWLAALRRAYPDWAILHDPWHNVWFAVRGSNGFARAASAIDLTTFLESQKRKWLAVRRDKK